MAKLYIFGIGGTGSRVLRALTMLLASGADTNNYSIVPIIIDPDKSNGNLTQNVDLLNNYMKIRQNLSFAPGNRNRFFLTEIEQIIPDFTIPIAKTNDCKFGEFINIAGMAKTNAAMTRMLFSDENLNSSMEIGFKGNPNIGSVVLNQIPASEQFRTFAQQFRPGDKIFIISSIFGGTGASGFPLLLKTMRTADADIPNNEAIKNAIIGAITVLPYFKLLENADSAVDSATFISKSKSALAYYEKNIANSGQTPINALYFIGDNTCGMYENTDGGNGQTNKAHAIELLAASAILDFANSDLAPTDHSYRELGVRVPDTGNDTLSLPSFFDGISSMLRPMARLAFMHVGLKYDRDFLFSNKLAKNTDIGLDNRFYESSFVRDVRNFLTKYEEWLKEMKENNVSMNLFNFDCKPDPFSFMEGISVKKKIWGSYGWDTYRSALNNASVGSNTLNDRFLEMYHEAMKVLCAEKFIY